MWRSDHVQCSRDKSHDKTLVLCHCCITPVVPHLSAVTQSRRLYLVLLHQSWTRLLRHQFRLPKRARRRTGRGKSAGNKKSGWAAHVADGWAPDAKAESTTWTSKYGSISFNIMAVHMAWAGMNEQGLTASTMFLAETSTPKPGAKPVLEGSVWLQYLLDTCATVDEVVNKCNEFRVDTVNHHLFCDRTGKCAIVEFLDGQVKCRVGEQVPVKVLTNTVYEKSLAAFSQASIDDTDPFRSLTRFRTVARVWPNWMSRRSRHWNSLCRTLGEATQCSPTQWSIVFDVSGQRVSFRTREHPQVRSIDVGRLDFAPNAQQKVLNIQCKRVGRRDRPAGRLFACAGDCTYKTRSRCIPRAYGHCRSTGSSCVC